MANLFDQFDRERAAPPSANVFDQFENEPAAPPPNRLKAAATGVASLVPDLLGLPVDTVTNLRNLDRAAYGYAKRELTGSRNIPDVIDPATQVGGSEWMKRKLSELFGVDPFHNPNPEDAASRMLHTGSEIMASGGRNAAKMIPSAVGGAVGSEAAGAVGGVVGAVAPAVLGARGKLAAPNAAAKEAVDAGYSLPPTQIKKTAGSVIGEGLAGSASTERSVVGRNQRVTDAAVRADMGLPENTPLKPQVFSQIRKESGAAYEALKESGVRIQANDAYINGVAQLGQEFQAAAKEFPELFRNEKLSVLQDSLMRSEMTPNAAVELTKKLRADASANLKAFDDTEKMALGLAQRKAAGLIETLVEDNLAAQGKNGLVDAWRAARQRIAKAHDYESALDQHGNIDARILGRLFDKGAPMSGAMEQIAKFGSGFGKSARTPEALGSDTPQLNLKAIGFRYGIPGLIGYAVGGPAAAIAADSLVLAAPPIARAIITSRAYQNSLARRGLNINALAPYLASKNGE